jgi:hypothetical protein
MKYIIPFCVATLSCVCPHEHKTIEPLKDKTYIPEDPNSPESPASEGELSLISPDDLNEKETYQVIARTLLVRQGRGTDKKIEKRLYFGDKVEVFRIEGDWAQVGHGQWAHKNYLKKTFP